MTATTPLRLAPLALSLALAACASAPPPGVRSVTIERTTYGIAHITAPDYEGIAYGVAYAHAQDNVCQTAEHLITVRGERSQFFGAQAMGLIGLGQLPNAQIDLFMRAHMDDAALARAAASNSEEVQGLAARLRGRLQPLPAGRRAQRPARGLPQQAVGAADVDGRPVAHHRDVDDPGRHRRAGRRRARGRTAGGDRGTPKRRSTCSRPQPRSPATASTPTPKAASSAPTAGPSAATPRPTAAAWCWAIRTSRGTAPTASGKCTSPSPASST